LFVFARLVRGGEERDAELLARTLDPARYQIDAIACFHLDGTDGPAPTWLEAAGVRVDRTAYNLSFGDTVAYLASRLPSYDVVVSCQNVADIYPAFEQLQFRPPLIEYGTRLSDARAGPKHLTARYVGANALIRNAAAARMPNREDHAVVLRPMIDTAALKSAMRSPMRAVLGVNGNEPLVGLVGGFDAQVRLEDMAAVADLVRRQRPLARLVVVPEPPTPNASFHEESRALASALGLKAEVFLLENGADWADLLPALDVLVVPSPGESMPHLIAEAGASGLPVVATGDRSSTGPILNDKSGLLVPNPTPQQIADAIVKLIDDPALAARLGSTLQRQIETACALHVVVPQWEALLAEVLAEQPPRRSPENVFRSFLQGGFECSSHRRGHDQRRIDMIAASHHDLHAEHDLRELSRHGILTVRDGLRWHLIERAAGDYDWGSAAGQLAAARKTGSEVIWDLLHYGWPDHLDIWMPEFPSHFAAFAAAAAQHIRTECSAARRFYAPINEISFLSWAGGEVAYFNPFAQRRGQELKVQLARAAIAAMDAILAVDPSARFVHVDPLINIVADPLQPEDVAAAEANRLAQYQAWDMIAGRAWPQIGGRPELLDIVGVNFYSNNQWIEGGSPLALDHPLARPFHEMLAETYARYGRPLFVAETGIEGEARVGWLKMIMREVDIAIARGVPVEGVCLYPILDHPGWDDDRYCPNGLLACSPLADERRAHRGLTREIASIFRGRRAQRNRSR
jgi:glycosyltransferase involved in cell wall biosynthesis